MGEGSLYREGIVGIEGIKDRYIIKGLLEGGGKGRYILKGVCGGINELHTVNESEKYRGGVRRRGG